MRINIIAVTCGLLPFTASALTYQVKDGEQLGLILKSQSFTPLWGENGYVKRTIKLNPKTIKSNGDFIIERALINLPADEKTLAHNIPLQQTIAFTNAAPQVIQLKPEQVSLSASASTRVMHIDGKDKSSGLQETIKNDPAPGLKISFDHKSKPDRAYGAYFSNHRLDFMKPGGKSLKRESRSFNEFGISITKDIGESRILNLSLALEERPLLFINSNTDLLLERVSIPKLSLTYSPQLIESKYLKLSGLVGASLLMAMKREDYYINPGHNLYAGISGRYLLSEKVEAISALSTDYSEQHSSQSENKYSEVTFSLGVNFITDAPKLEK